MKKIYVFLILLFGTILCNSAYCNEDLTRIKCDCVYGQTITKEIKTGVITDINDRLVNSETTMYFYIDDKQKKIYDSEKKVKKAIIFNKDTIYTWEVVELKDYNTTNGEIFEIDRNTGDIAGSIIWEYWSKGKQLRTSTELRGTCYKINSENKF